MVSRLQVDQSLLTSHTVIHFIQSADTGVYDIAAILKGIPPGPTELGTRDYTTRPIAIILGAAFDDGGAEKMMNSAEGLKPLPWLRPDLSKPTPPIGPDYGKAIVLRIKETLKRLEDDGKLNETKVYLH